MTYKWDNPYEWFEDHVNWLVGNGDYEVLAAEFLSLARELDFDSLQEHYEHYMDEDGYFDEVEAE